MSAALRRSALRRSRGASAGGTTLRRCANDSVPTMAVTNGWGRSRSNDPKSWPKPVRAIVSRVSFVMSPGTSTASPAASRASQAAIRRPETSSISGW